MFSKWNFAHEEKKAKVPVFVISPLCERSDPIGFYDFLDGSFFHLKWTTKTQLQPSGTSLTIKKNVSIESSKCLTMEEQIFNLSFT